MYDVVNNLKPDLLIRASMVNSNLLFPQVNLRNQGISLKWTNPEEWDRIRISKQNVSKRKYQGMGKTNMVTKRKLCYMKVKNGVV